MSNERNSDDRLNRELAALGRELAPDRDLWPGIHHAINRGRQRRLKPLAAAASVVLAVGLAFFAGILIETPRESAPDVAAFIDRLQTRHENVKQSLLVEYSEREPLTQDWQMQMEQLEQAEQQIYEAYRENPENLELLKILRNVQNRQIDLINAVYGPGFTTI